MNIPQMPAANLGPDWTAQHEYETGFACGPDPTAAFTRQGIDMPNINQMMPSKYLKKEDVPQPALVTVRSFTHENVAPSGQPEEKKWIIHFNEFESGMVMNPTNLQLAAIALGSEDTEDWIGHQVVIYNDPNVSFGGKLTGGIRIRQVRRKAVQQPAPVQRPQMPQQRQQPPSTAENFEDMDSDIPF